MDEESFTKQMRKATRDVHAVSDALVNAKLAFGKIPYFFTLHLE